MSADQDQHAPTVAGVYRRALVGSQIGYRYRLPSDEVAVLIRCMLPVMAGFVRISIDPAVMGGVPCIRNLRFPVASVVAMVADGMSHDEILEEHPDLVQEDIREALRFAALALQERQLPLQQSA